MSVKTLKKQVTRETQALFVTLEEMSVLQIKRGGDTSEIQTTSWNVTIQEADLDQNTKEHLTN